MSPTLLTVPREIRDRIYYFVLLSPTGCIIATREDHRYSSQTLLSKSPTYSFVVCDPPRYFRDDIIRFSLLQTNRQIYSEAKNVLYERNTVVFMIDDFVTSYRPQYPFLSHRIQHIYLSGGFTHKEEIQQTAKALNILQNWAKEVGCLRSMTLNFVDGIHDMEELQSNRALGSESSNSWLGGMPNHSLSLLEAYLEMLRRSREGGQWTNVQRKIDFCRVEHLKQSNRDPVDVVRAIHDAFGGELWFGDYLCYKDGKEMLRPFVKADFGTGWQEAWFADDKK
jgi:hypothetical protein